MKDIAIAFFHRLFGYERYLFIFACYKILTFRILAHEREFKAFLNYIEPDDTVLDIGANIGVMSVLLSNKMNSNGSVIAFEPIPSNYRVLQKILKFFRSFNVKTLKWALGEQKGQLKMIIPIRNNAKKHGLSHIVDGNKKTEHGVIHEIEVQTLDSLVNDGQIPKVNAIKIDVENFELEVLSGGLKLLKQDKPKIFCELWENDKRLRVMGLLKEIGYEIYVLHADKVAKFKPEEHVSNSNFIFLPLN